MHPFFLQRQKLQSYHVIISGILLLVVNTLQEFAFKILVYLLVSCKQLLGLNNILYYFKFYKVRNCS